MVRLLRRLSALERRVSALFRTGKVAEVQLAPYRVRVDLGPDGEGEPVLTDLLPVAVARAGEVRTWSPLTVGERVEVLSPGGEDAAVFVRPSLISEDFEAPSELAGDELVRYDALDAPGTELGRVHVSRGETVPASAWEVRLGPCMLRLAGDGTVTITNGEATITISGANVTVAAARVDYQDP